MPKVYEGSVELDISNFIKGLNEMEAAATKTADNILGIFRALDANIGGALGNFNGTVSSVMATAKSIESTITSINGGLVQSQQTAVAATKAASAQRAQATAEAISAARAQTQAEAAENRIKLAQADRAAKDQERLYKDALARDLASLKARNEREAQMLADKLQQQFRQISDEIAREQAAQEAALKKVADLRRAEAAALSAGDKPGAASKATEARAAEVAAQQAFDKEAALQRQLTAVMDAERTTQTAIARKASSDRTSIAAEEARQFRSGWLAAMQVAVSDARDHIRKVEDEWNSIFRAGSQLNTVGVQLQNFAKNVTQMGANITNNAGDFDFWARRVVASAKSANEGLYDVFGGQKQTIDAFSDGIMRLGEELGTLAPEEVAKGFYLYQSAAGQAITTQEQLETATTGLNTVFKAAIISDTDYATAIRGVTQAMAEFGLGADEMSHAASVMLNLTQTSQAEFSDVLEAFKMVGPQAADLGITFEETSAILSRLSDYGLKGSAAGRALSMSIATILDPSDKANGLLQNLFVTSQGLSGSWQDIIFKGGHFVGMLDEVDAATGQTTKGFLSLFAEATQGMSATQREAAIAGIFSQNAARTMIPLVKEYSDALNGTKSAALEGKDSMEEMMRAFEDATKQASLFNGQWELVADSIKVRMAQATYGIKESLVRIGYMVAETFIPLMEWLNKALKAVVSWAEGNEALTRGILEVVKWVVVLAGALGPLLVILGSVFKAVASFEVILATLKGVADVSAVAFGSVLGPAIAAIAGPLATAALAIGVLYLAWKTNFLGMGQVLEQVFGGLALELDSLVSVVNSALGLIQALFTGNTEKIAEELRRFGTYVLEAFVVLPQDLANALYGAGYALGTWVNTTFGDLSSSLSTWGANLMFSLASGALSAAGYVYDVVAGVAEGIAQYFRSYSPPRYGPLMGIWDWGRNLFGTLIDGMKAADLSAVTDIAGSIGEAIKNNIKLSGGDASQYQESMLEAYQLSGQMVETIRNGGTVSEDFFEPLRSGLGEWYQGVVNVQMAYAQVYSISSRLDAEKERLEVLKAQGDAIRAQQEARQDEFDRALGINNASTLNGGTPELVDPTTEEGQRKISEMRQRLSREEFQNWINWQKAAWGQRDELEQKAQETAEQTQQSTVDAMEKELELAQAQYDYYNKQYELALKMYQLQKEEDELVKAQLAAQQGPKAPIYGTPEQLAAYQQEIAGKVGPDTVLATETMLSTAAGGDDVRAYSDAVKQKEAEERRLSELEKMNREKRAEFEAELIAATSEDQRREIKERKDAWDAAYREQKSQLTERLQIAKEIVEAAEKQADASMAGRVEDEQVEYQKEILDALGDQAKKIRDANELKAAAGSLDAAQAEARGQMREEERKLAELQNINDQKKIEFERRLREAKDDPEATRRIKEEQDAWEAAYKSAYEAQQARVQAARIAQQDLGDEKAALPDKAKGGGGLGGLGGGGGLGDLAEKERKRQEEERRRREEDEAKMVENKRKTEESERRSSLERASRMWKAIEDRLNALKPLLTDSQKLSMALGELGRTVGDQVIGPLLQFYLRVTGLGAAFNYLKLPLEGVWANLNQMGGPIEQVKEAWDRLVKVIVSSVGPQVQSLINYLSWLWERLTTGKELTNALTTVWNTYLLPVLNKVGQVVKDDIIPILGSVLATALETVAFLTNKLAEVWEKILMPVIQLSWSFIQTFLVPILSGLLFLALEAVKGAAANLAKTWDQVLAPALKTLWKFVDENLLPVLKLLIDVALLLIEAQMKAITNTWNDFLAPALNTFWKFVEETLLPALKSLGNYINDFLNPFLKENDKAWQGVWDIINDGIGVLGDWIEKAQTAIDTLRTWLGLGGQKPAEPNNTPSGPSSDGGDDDVPTDGSHALGLRRVPKDGYIAELHQGERVLTAAEASLYNALEAIAGAPEALAGVLGPQQRAAPEAAATTNNNRITNFGGVNVVVDSEDSSRALLSRLAHLA